MHLKKIILTVLLLSGLQASALEFRSDTTYTNAPGEKIDRELWLLANEVELAGTAQNDLFLAAGSNLTLSGRFEGSLWGFGTTVQLDGEARRNVRLAGQTVQVNGELDGNLMAAAATALKLGAESQLKGDAYLYGKTVIIEGASRGRMTLIGQRITVSARIDGDLVVTGTEINIQPDSRIGGNLYYTAPKELILPAGIVEGELKRILPAQTPSRLSPARLLSTLFWMAAALLTGLPFLSLFPMTSALASQTIRQFPWRCLGIGALAFMLTGLRAVATTVTFGLICSTTAAGSAPGRAP